jgi:hypothetical protein
MCDYSLHAVRSRPAKVGEKLVTTNFRGTGTRGFASPSDPGTAVCVLPGTELAFVNEVCHDGWTIGSLIRQRLSFPVRTGHSTAIFRQINTGHHLNHHDALEFPDGQIVLLTGLCTGQQATVVQLPAEPRTVEQAKEQGRRTEFHPGGAPASMTPTRRAAAVSETASSA